MKLYGYSDRNGHDFTVVYTENKGFPTITSTLTYQLYVYIFNLGDNSGKKRDNIIVIIG